MNSAADVWNQVIDTLRENRTVTETTINTFFRPCRAVSMDMKRIYLYASKLPRDVIEGRYKGMIDEILQDIFSGDFTFTFVDEDGSGSNGGKSANQFIDNGEYTFENFVVGPSNRFAHAAAKAVATGQTKDYNPLFIYGESGLGKTHLLYAIYHEMTKNHPNYNIVYVKGETFTNELISAIQSGHNIEFREKYRGSNVLLIDDIQFISGKVSTQEEFFHTFNTLYEANRQIVFTSDRPPHEIARLEDRLRSRFESGLLCDIQAPDYETRMAIIKNKTMQMNSLLPEEVMNCIAEKMTANVRQIEGAVKCVTAQQDLMGREITPKLTEEILKRYVQEEVAFTPTPDMIIEETARFYNITAEDIKGRLKTKNITLPRQISMYIIRTRANLSLNDIGDIFGRDHSTILHAINKIEEDIKNDGEFAKTIKDIISNIYSKQ
ncbi:MAG: chromosomal replication initiator protein DnaA [Oscillospiraceae bacterium]|nr:chromosomal replication initiator protein DnaA [Oscillospiraceae bacterium]MBQ8929971.1 chromosomal replication initiator protein DnaA [Oscillospiraceae bacterium]MBR6430009.1 chromosomal replication initiator protein DnaA [Oscillospiraceae bacterium]